MLLFCGNGGFGFFFFFFAWFGVCLGFFGAAVVCVPSGGRMGVRVGDNP